MRRLVMVILLSAFRQICCADAFIIGPTPPPGSIGGPTEVGTIYPFLIKQLDLHPTAPKPTMRYQQVYNSSLFTNLDPSLIYVSTLTFFPHVTEPPICGWTVPQMQVNLSTTMKDADSLSLVFDENVGADDTIVFGPRSYDFPGDRQLILFNKPFRYNPFLGNLLVDVRIFDGSGPFCKMNPFPNMMAYNSPTDEVSRVWATNVTAASASGSDTIGLDTVIELSPLPSLQ